MGRAGRSPNRRQRRAWSWRVDVPGGAPSLQTSPPQGMRQV